MSNCTDFPLGNQVGKLCGDKIFTANGAYVGQAPQGLPGYQFQPVEPYTQNSNPQPMSQPIGMTKEMHDAHLRSLQEQESKTPARVIEPDSGRAGLYKALGIFAAISIGLYLYAKYVK